MVLFAASACPLHFGYRGLAALILIFHLLQNSMNIFEMNCGPLSVTILYGKPCRHMTFFQMKFVTVAAC